MKFRLISVAFAVLGFVGVAHAQSIVLSPASTLQFTSNDHTVTLSNGQPAITSYQAILLDAAADAASGTPLQTGPQIARAQVAAVTPATNPPTYQLTQAQLGLAVPACSIAQANCPNYTVVLLAIGPNGTSARGVASESNPFQSASTAVVPASPTNVKWKP